MGIRINTIAPGIFDTPMMAMAPDQVRLPLNLDDSISKEIRSTRRVRFSS
ncbi:MAG: hypothetical protein Ct9H90mP4_11430 [Gammaproteobacteria bacterium]|nr:MAG: hypothetical protein Ct9H90mP4_11430 [Gammaproteobacteria bacterium]